MVGEGEGGGEGRRGGGKERGSEGGVEEEGDSRGEGKGRRKADEQGGLSYNEWHSYHGSSSQRAPFFHVIIYGTNQRLDQEEHNQMYLSHTNQYLA